MYIKFRYLNKQVEKLVNKHHKTHQDPKMFNSRGTVGKLIAKLPMQRKVINERLEGWEYGLEGKEMWWKYLYKLILKENK